MHLALMLIARAGYSHVAYSEVAPEKASRFVERMMEEHLVHLPSEAIAARRKAGLPVARLIPAPYVEELPNYKEGVKRPVLPFLLLASAKLPGVDMRPVKPRLAKPWGRGRGDLHVFPHHRADRNPRGSLLTYTWRGRYVLGMRPRTSKAKATRPYAPTWFLTDWEFERWSVTLTRAARDGDVQALRKAFSYLAQYPRFGGVRQDLKVLIRAASKAFEPHRRRADGRRLAFPLPEELKTLRPLQAVRVWDDPPRTLGDVLRGV